MKISNLSVIAVIVLVIVGVTYFKNDRTLTGAASGSYVGVKTLEVPKKKTIRLAMLENKASPEFKGPSIAQVNTDPVLKLVDKLIGYGAKVQLNEITKDGLTSLQVNLDGKGLTPYITTCPECDVIVFEY